MCSDTLTFFSGSRFLEIELGDHGWMHGWMEGGRKGGKDMDGRIGWGDWIHRREQVSLWSLVIGKLGVCVW